MRACVCVFVLVFIVHSRCTAIANCSNWIFLLHHLPWYHYNPSAGRSYHGLRFLRGVVSLAFSLHSTIDMYTLRRYLFWTPRMTMHIRQQIVANSQFGYGDACWVMLAPPQNETKSMYVLCVYVLCVYVLCVLLYCYTLWVYKGLYSVRTRVSLFPFSKLLSLVVSVLCSTSCG